MNDPFLEAAKAHDDAKKDPFLAAAIGTDHPDNLKIADPSQELGPAMPVGPGMPTSAAEMGSPDPGKGIKQLPSVIPGVVDAFASFGMQLGAPFATAFVSVGSALAGSQSPLQDAEKMVSEAIYQPQTEVGKMLTTLVGLPFQAADKALDVAGDQVGWSGEQKAAVKTALYAALMAKMGQGKPKAAGISGEAPKLIPGEFVHESWKEALGDLDTTKKAKSIAENEKLHAKGEADYFEREKERSAKREADWQKQLASIDEERKTSKEGQQAKADKVEQIDRNLPEEGYMSSDGERVLWEDLSEKDKESYNIPGTNDKYVSPETRAEQNMKALEAENPDEAARQRELQQFHVEQDKVETTPNGFIDMARSADELPKKLRDIAKSLDGVFQSTAEKIHDFVTIKPTPALRRLGGSDSGALHSSARSITKVWTDHVMSQIFPDSYKKSEAQVAAKQEWMEDQLIFKQEDPSYKIKPFPFESKSPEYFADLRIKDQIIGIIKTHEEAIVRAKETKDLEAWKHHNVELQKYKERYGDKGLAAMKAELDWAHNALDSVDKETGEHLPGKLSRLESFISFVKKYQKKVEDARADIDRLKAKRDKSKSVTWKEQVEKVLEKEEKRTAAMEKKLDGYLHGGSIADLQAALDKRAAKEASHNKHYRDQLERFKAPGGALDTMQKLYKENNPNAAMSQGGHYDPSHFHLLGELPKESEPGVPEPRELKADVKKDRFSGHRLALKTYTRDMQRILETSHGGRFNEATKMHFLNDLISKGIAIKGEGFKEAIWANSPDNPRIAEMDTKKLTFNYPTGEFKEDGSAVVEPRTLYVRKDAWSEVEGVLNMADRGKQNAVFRALTAIQVAQLSDFFAHGINETAVLSRLNKFDNVIKDIGRKYPGVAQFNALKSARSVMKEMEADSPAYRAKVRKLYEVGGVERPEHFFDPTDLTALERGIQKITGGLQQKSSKFLHDYDIAGRLIMDEAFDHYVEKGLVKDTPQARRDFINMIGMYNRRLMGPLMRTFRDTGTAPFIVAGRTHTTNAVKSIFGDPGFKAEGTTQNVKIRLTNLTTMMIGVTTAPMLVNMATIGQPMARSGDPFTIDFGPKFDDENGNPYVWNVAKLTGLDRGERAIGLKALQEGITNHRSPGQIVGQAITQAADSRLHPWAGVGPKWALKAATGADLSVDRAHDVKKVQGGKIAQLGENVKEASKDVNKIAAAVVSSPGKVAEASDKSDAVAGAGVGLVESFVKSPLGSAGLKRQYHQRTGAEQFLHDDYGVEHKGDYIENTKTNAKIMKDLKGASEDDKDAYFEKHRAEIKSVQQFNKLWSSRDMTPLQNNFYKTRFEKPEKMIKFFDLATNDERDETGGMLIKKFDNAINAANKVEKGRGDAINDMLNSYLAKFPKRVVDKWWEDFENGKN